MMGIPFENLPKRVQALIQAQERGQNPRQTAQDAPESTPARLRVTLPWPPTVNHYWFRRGNRTFIGKKGQIFRAQVALEVRNVRTQPMGGPLFLSILAYPPDHRRRDIDNILKATLDALQHGWAYWDDSQIRRLRIEMLDPAEGKRGMIEVEIMPIQEV